MHTDKGKAKSAEERPSVREKLDRYKAEAAKDKEAGAVDLDKSNDKPKSQNRNNQTSNPKRAATNSRSFPLMSGKKRSRQKRKPCIR